MRICHVTPHLPPDQAANALLPAHLGRWAIARGDEVEYIAHPPRASAEASSGASPTRVSPTTASPTRVSPTTASTAASAGVSPRTTHSAGSAPEPQAGPVTWIAPNRASGLLRRLGSIATARRIRRDATAVLQRADLVHVHSNGLLVEVAARLALGLGKPVVLTLYGTEIWHYRRKPWPFDLFTPIYHASTHVTFYSRGLHDKAIEFGLTRPGLTVVYPPVVEAFAPAPPDRRAALRQQLGLHAKNVLLNVKRLHPLAGQEFLIEAMPEVLRHHPDTQLVICGTGALAGELRARAERLGVGDRVTLAGLVANTTVADYNRAADLFVLPSRLEALPTVAVEALACGTPVVSADHPGGVELNRLFGDDVAVVPREDTARLAHAIIDRLNAGTTGTPRRTRPETADVLTREFRPAAVAARFWKIYEDAGRRVSE